MTATQDTYVCAGPYGHRALLNSFERQAGMLRQRREWLRRDEVTVEIRFPWEWE